MKKSILSLVFISLFGLMSYAQGNLQFNQVKIVSNVLETVPTDKVWKVTSIYGHEFVLNHCVSNETSFDWLGIKCNAWYRSGTRSARISYFATIFIVNGKQIVNEISGLPIEVDAFSGSQNCTGTQTGSLTVLGVTCANRAANPNLMPLWLPAGTTLQTHGPNTFVSVIEFNIIP